MRGANLDGFRVLDRIITKGSFARAAASLNKTVPAISYTVAQLESSYGLKLLDRSGYRVKLTDSGTRMLKEAHNLLGQAEYLDSVAERLKHNWEPKLEVVIDGMLLPGLVLQAVEKVAAMGAPTTIQLTTEYLSGVATRFDTAGADIMLSLGFAIDDRWLSEHLFDVEVILVAAPGTGLVPDRQYSHDQLSRQVEVSVQDSSFNTPEPGRSLGIPNIFYVGDFYTKKQAILKGMGIGWMPESWVEDELSCGLLFEVNYTAGSRDRYPVSVGTWKYRQPGRAQERFITSVRHYAQKAQVNST